MEEELTRYQRYYRKNKEKVKERCRLYREKNKERVNRKNREDLRKKREDPEFRKQDAERARTYRKELRAEVLGHYGAHCACCGETTPEFLCIDHINGGGTQHRKQIGGSSPSMYAWIRKQGFPDDFRVLCHNCNQSLGLYGFCPHQKTDK